MVAKVRCFTPTYRLVLLGFFRRGESVTDYPKHLNVAVYLRKSRTDMEAEARGEGETLSKHRRSLMDLAKRNQYGIDDIYEELESGDRILDRPEMQRMLSAVQNGKYNAVLCMDIDRLGRGNMIDQGLIQEAFKTSRTLIITPRKVYNLEDEMDEEWTEFEAFMARRELKIITRRMQRGRRDSSREGKHIAKKPPYGYARGEDLKLYPDPDTAPVIRQIFEWSAEGLGQMQIARKLTELGVLSPAGNNVWQSSSIHALLKNPAYRGKIVWGKHQYRKRTNGTKGYDRNRQSEEKWIVHEDAHEALVDEETYARYLQAVDKKPKVSNKRELSNPLASILFCSQCHRVMTRRPRHNRPHDQLLCVTHGCDTRGIAFDAVEERMLETLRDILDNLKFENKKTSKRNADGELALLQRKETELQKSTEELWEQRGNLHDLLERGVYDADTFLDRNRLLGERIENAEKELSETKGRMIDLEKRTMRIPDLRPRLIIVLNSYGKAKTAKKKNELLKSVIERIEYTRQQSWSKRDQFELDIRLRF